MSETLERGRWRVQRGAIWSGKSQIWQFQPGEPGHPEYPPDWSDIGEGTNSDADLADLAVLCGQASGQVVLSPTALAGVLEEAARKGWFAAGDHAGEPGYAHVLAIALELTNRLTATAQGGE
jgi:hypothetical protein